MTITEGFLSHGAGQETLDKMSQRIEAGNGANVCGRDGSDRTVGPKFSKYGILCGNKVEQVSLGGFSHMI